MRENHKPRTSPAKLGHLWLPAGLDKEWSDLAWGEEPLAPKKKRHRGVSHRGRGSLARHRLKRHDDWNRKRAERLGKKIKSDFERARLVALAECQKKLQEYRIEIAIAEFEERYAAGEKAWLEQCRRDADAYCEKLRKAAA